MSGVSRPVTEVGGVRRVGYRWSRNSMSGVSGPVTEVGGVGSGYCKGATIRGPQTPDRPRDQSHGQQ